MKYVSTERVKKLQLRVMNYLGDTLLIREEYHHALEELTSRASGKVEAVVWWLLGKRELVCNFL
jgi:hypothetical protein